MAEPTDCGADELSAIMAQLKKMEKGWEEARKAREGAAVKHERSFEHKEKKALGSAKDNLTNLTKKTASSKIETKPSSEPEIESEAEVSMDSDSMTLSNESVTPIRTGYESPFDNDWGFSSILDPESLSTAGSKSPSTAGSDTPSSTDSNSTSSTKAGTESLANTKPGAYINFEAKQTAGPKGGKKTETSLKLTLKSKTKSRSVNVDNIKLETEHRITSHKTTETKSKRKTKIGLKKTYNMAIEKEVKVKDEAEKMAEDSWYIEDSDLDIMSTAASFFDSSGEEEDEDQAESERSARRATDQANSNLFGLFD